MNIEEIMKPYYDAKAEIKKEIQSNKSEKEIKSEQLFLEKNRLQLRLERLIEKKQSEIDEYILSIDAREYSYNPNYLIDKKRELELEYEKAEQELKQQIEELDKEIKEMNQTDYSNLLYDKKVPGIKEIARAQAARLVIELEVKLESKELELQLVDLDIKSLRNKFYSWKIEETMVELQPYYQTKDRILKEIEELKKLIERVKTESNLLYNDEELNEILKGTFEKIEVIKPANELEKTAREEIEQESIVLEQEELSQPIELNTQNDYLSADDFETPVLYDDEEIQTLEEVRSPLEPKTESNFDEEEVVENDNINEMLENIFTDIIGCAKKLRTVKLEGETLSIKDSTQTKYEESGDLEIDKEQIELPNGVYLNADDFEEALDNYYKKEKGNSYKVKNYDSVMTVTSEVIDSIKKSLTECSVISLLKKKILGIFDIKRVYGKEKAEAYDRKVKLGTVKTKLPVGDYVNLNELVAKLGITFAEKSQSWLDKLKKIPDKETEKIEEQIQTDSIDLKNINFEENLEFDDIKAINLEKTL